MDQAQRTSQDFSGFPTCPAPAMFYGGAFDVAVIWGLPPPLLLGVYSVRLLTRTASLQRGPLEAPIAPDDVVAVAIFMISNNNHSPRP